MRHVMSCALKSSLLILFAACTAQPPIVADPPEHERPASELVPWEEEYGRAMMRPEALADSPPDLHSEQQFNGHMEHADERGALGAMADVLAFPFRAIGWLFQAIF